MEQVARVNDFKPLGELRADPVPMKSFSIFGLQKMLGCKPTVKLGWFCARLLRRGQCTTFPLAHTEQRTTESLFLAHDSQFDNGYCNLLKPTHRKDCLCPEGERRIVATLGKMTCP